MDQNSEDFGFVRGDPRIYVIFCETNQGLDLCHKKILVYVLEYCQLLRAKHGMELPLAKCARVGSQPCQWVKKYRSAYELQSIIDQNLGIVPPCYLLPVT